MKFQVINSTLQSFGVDNLLSPLYRVDQRSGQERLRTFVREVQSTSKFRMQNLEFRILGAKLCPVIDTEIDTVIYCLRYSSRAPATCGERPIDGTVFT